MSQDSNSSKASNSAPGAVVNEQQWNAITQAIAGLNRDQLTWVSGYAAGMAAAQGGAVAPAIQDQAAVAGDIPTLTILYGSQTGNAKTLAHECQAKAEGAGFNSKLVSMADYKARNLKNETHVAVFVSTHGEGDAPDDAVELHEYVGSKKAPKLAYLDNTQPFYHGQQIY